MAVMQLHAKGEAVCLLSDPTGRLTKQLKNATGNQSPRICTNTGTGDFLLADLFQPGV